MKFNEGDYICYTPSEEQEVIDGLLGMEQELFSKDLEGTRYHFFMFKDEQWSRFNGSNGFFRVSKTDITKKFFSNVRSKKLPEKFKIKLNNKEDREWLVKKLLKEHELDFDDINKITREKFVLFDLGRAYGTISFVTSHAYATSLYEEVIPFHETNKPDLDSLPDLFYIDCGDKKEVREWLFGLGFNWISGFSVKGYKATSAMYFLNKKNMTCTIHPRNKEDYVFLTPIITKKQIQIDAVTSFTIESKESKELSELKKAYEELGEDIKYLSLDTVDGHIFFDKEN